MKAKYKAILLSPCHSINPAYTVHGCVFGQDQAQTDPGLLDGSLTDDLPFYTKNLQAVLENIHVYRCRRGE